MANAYCKMSEFEMAIEYYDKSISLCPNNDDFCKEIMKKKQEIKNGINSKKQNLNGLGNQCDQSIRTRLAGIPNLIQEKDLKPKSEMTSKELSALNEKIQFLSRMSGNPSNEFNFYDNTVPSFELESYPSWCNVKKCKERINQNYEITKSRNVMYNSYIRKMIRPDNVEYFKRIGNTMPQTLEWYTKGILGDINKHHVVIEYDPTILHSFSNEINKSEILTPGTTHVAIGFTDLGIFHTAKFNAELTPEKSLKWFGYEASAYCCAKTAIITTMMMMNAPSDHVLQVWYSATWSKETLKSFKSAIEMLLNSN